MKQEENSLFISYIKRCKVFSYAHFVLGGTLSSTFFTTQIGTKVCQYRENRWYASQNIFKLVPLDNAMNKASKFLTTVITQALKCTYSDDTYSSYPTLKSLRQQEIKLPVDDNGEPDWVYMEDYMKQIEQKAAKKLELLQVTRG